MLTEGQLQLTMSFVVFLNGAAIAQLAPAVVCYFHNFFFQVERITQCSIQNLLKYYIDIKLELSYF